MLAIATHANPWSACPYKKYWCGVHQIRVVVECTMDEINWQLLVHVCKGCGPSQLRLWSESVYVVSIHNHIKAGVSFYSNELYK